MEKYKEDLSEIRAIMDRSSRFISLSGMSGIASGTVALIGAFVAYRLVYQQIYTESDYINYRRIDSSMETFWVLCSIACIVLVVSLVTGMFFTMRKAKKNSQGIWNTQTKQLLVNLLIPLISGGLLCLILLSKGFIALVAPLTLVFYGLALVNASKYTLSEIRSLGIIEICLGLIGCKFIGFGLILCSIGFGVLHISYGIYMHIKYDS